MVSISLTALAALAGFFAQSALAAPSPTVDSEGVYVKRAASCTFPTPPKTSSLSAAKTITGTFDGKRLSPIHAINLSVSAQAATFATIAARARVEARPKAATRTRSSFSSRVQPCSTLLPLHIPTTAH
jgi:hypothetical protein